MGTTMSEETLRLINKGAREPIVDLMQQGAMTREVMTLHEATLRRFGLTDARRDALVKTEEALQKLIASGAAQREEARETTRSRNRELGAAKAYIRCLQQAVPMALADGRAAKDPKVNGINPSVFIIRALGRHPSGVVQYLSRVESFVEVLDPYLKPFFQGESALKRHKELRGALADAEAIQDSTRVNLPTSTAEYRALKGLLLEAIEDINRIGRIAFNGDATSSAPFNKDLLVRGRSRKTPTPLPAPEPKPE